MGAFLSWTTDAGVSKTLFFDVCTEEGQELASTATENPIEDDANVSDHVKRELNRANLEVFVSNTPIDDTNQRGGRVQTIVLHPPKYRPPLAPTPGAVFTALGNGVRDAVDALLGKNDELGANVLAWDDVFDAVAETLATLEEIRATSQLVDVVMTSKVYENMLLTNVSVSGNAGTGTGRGFRLEFRELRKVQVRIVNAPKPTEIRGATAKPKGAQTTKAAAAEGPKKSILKSASQHLPPEVTDFFKGLGLVK